MIIAGGVTGSSMSLTSGSEIYYVSSNSWSRLPDMPHAKFLHRSVYITGSGDVLVVGGQDPTSTLLTSSFVYVSASNSWIDAGATSIIWQTGSAYNLACASAL